MADLERLIQAIDAAEQSAYGSDTDSDLQVDRALAIDMYHGKNIEPAPEGRSQVTDRTVFETVHWIMPSLTRIFANGDQIIEFQPFGREDEKGAKQEGEHLNYLVTQKNPWPVIFNTWAMDALLSKNGYCEPYIESKVQTELETYERLSAPSLALLLQDDVEVVEHSAEPDPKQLEPVTDEMGQPMLDPMGQPMTQPRVLHTVTIRKTKPRRKLCFKVIPPERTKCDINLETFMLADANYFEYWDDVTVSHLRAVGFDVPDDIETDERDHTEEGRARDLYSEEAIEGDNDVDPSMRKVRLRCIWIRHDTDEDGIAELQKCYRVGEKILERDGKPAIYHCTRVGVACITPNINPHRHIGTSEADLTIEVQRIKTAILRQGLDGLYFALNPETAVSNEVNIDDYMVSRPGGIKRMIEGSAALPGEGHVMPIVRQNVFPDAIAGLEYMGQVSESRTGVSRAFSGVDPSTLNSGNSSGVAINQLSTMASQRVEQIARIFSVGVEYLFSLAHELVIKSGHEPEVVKLRGEYTTIDPSTWKTGRDMRIVVGYGAGNKDALVSRLMLIANMQKEMLVGGLPTVSPQNVYETALEIVKASDFSAPQRFFTDPSTVPPKPPPEPSPDVKLGAEVELAKTQSSERVKAAEIQSQERIKQAELLARDQIEKFKGELAIVLEKMKQGGEAEIESLKTSLKADLEGKPRTDVITPINQKVAQLERALAEAKAEAAAAIQEANGPREVVRDSGGRVAGVKVGNKVRRVVRDKDNRITGLQ